MNVAIDYDKTYTLDPELWNSFIEQLNSRGHKVWCVTSRIDSPANQSEVIIPNAMTIFCGFASKVWYTKELGISIDVWIDDDPAMCAFGSEEKPVVKTVKRWKHYRRLPTRVR
jgi:hypothetical protein